MKAYARFILVYLLLVAKSGISAEHTANALFQSEKYAEVISLLSSEMEEDAKSEQAYLYAASLFHLGFPVLSQWYFSQARTPESKRDKDLVYQYIKSIHADKKGVFPYGSTFLPILEKAGARISKLETLQGMVHFHSGVNFVEKGDTEKALHEFRAVQPKNVEYLRAIFFLGVLENRLGHVTLAKSHFLQVYELSSKHKNSSLRDQAALNIARLYYAEKNFKDALIFYSHIPETSEFWLQAVLESGWAFYFIDKPGNSLGNLRTILSSFYEKRFYPEAYVLQGVTLLKECYFKSANQSAFFFQKKYKPILNEMRNLEKMRTENPLHIFHVFESYITKAPIKYEESGNVLDRVFRDSSVQREWIHFSLIQSELRKLSTSAISSAAKISLRSQLLEREKEKKSSLASFLGKRFHRQLKYLEDISVQIQLLSAQAALGNLDVVRAEAKVGSEQKTGHYVAGLKEVTLTDRLEYWPFEGEYWRDEFGYVYKLTNLCASK